MNGSSLRKFMQEREEEKQRKAEEVAVLNSACLNEGTIDASKAKNFNPHQLMGMGVVVKRNLSDDSYIVGVAVTYKDYCITETFERPANASTTSLYLEGLTKMADMVTVAPNARIYVSGVDSEAFRALMKYTIEGTRVALLKLSWNDYENRFRYYLDTKATRWLFSTQSEETYSELESADMPEVYQASLSAPNDNLFDYENENWALLNIVPDHESNVYEIRVHVHAEGFSTTRLVKVDVQSFEDVEEALALYNTGFGMIAELAGINRILMIFVNGPYRKMYVRSQQQMDSNTMAELGTLKNNLVNNQVKFSFNGLTTYKWFLTTQQDANELPDKTEKNVPEKRQSEVTSKVRVMLNVKKNYAMSKSVLHIVTYDIVAAHKYSYRRVLIPWDENVSRTVVSTVMEHLSSVQHEVNDVWVPAEYESHMFLEVQNRFTVKVLNSERFTNNIKNSTLPNRVACLFQPTRTPIRRHTKEDHTSMNFVVYSDASFHIKGNEVNPGYGHGVVIGQNIPGVGDTQNTTISSWVQTTSTVANTTRLELDGMVRSISECYRMFTQDSHGLRRMSVTIYCDNIAAVRTLRNLYKSVRDETHVQQVRDLLGKEISCDESIAEWLTNSRVHVNACWVRGHSDNIANVTADKLANLASKRGSHSIGSVKHRNEIEAVTKRFTKSTLDSLMFM